VVKKSSRLCFGLVDHLFQETPTRNEAVLRPEISAAKILHQPDQSIDPVTPIEVRRNFLTEV
jgi:hypothetical protein